MPCDGNQRVKYGRRPEAYSPECVEVEFCELRLYRILRSSSVRRCRKFPCYTYRTLENSSTVKPASLIRALRSPRFNSL
jgi:hypothetical protein